MKYTNEPLRVAEELIGKKWDIGGKEVEIVETEAYKGGKQTPSRDCMTKGPGVLWPMPHRGLYFLNVGTEAEGEPSCVMIRAAVVDGVLIDGPGKVGNGLGAKSLEGKVLEEDIPVTGETQASWFYAPLKRSKNSKGGYRSLEHPIK